MSQELFAKIIGCAKKTLISYEKGKSIPNDSYLIILRNLKSKPDTIKTIIDANKEFNSSIFEKEELEILKQVKEKFIKFESKDIVEFSHKEKAFTSTEFFEKISYDYAFDIESI